MVAPEDVLKFWLDDVGAKGWYDATESVDQQIRDLFMVAWENARDGSYGLWLTYPSGVLAYVVLLDQFSRNMFRNDPRAYQMDGTALAAAKVAIGRGWDMQIDEPARQFFYLPLMHSESLSDQDRCVRLICERMPLGGPHVLVHARAHREVIRRFGRFPHRNAVLGRSSTPQELTFEASGGYSEMLRQIQHVA